LWFYPYFTPPPAQVQVEKALGLPKPSLSQYEAGNREPKLSRLMEFAELFKISVDELVGRTKPGRIGHRP